MNIESEQAAFEAAYSGEYGTPLSVLRLLREGDAYIEKPQHSDRLNSSWWMWKQARAAPTASAPNHSEQARELTLEEVTVERDFMGTIHIKSGDFDFIQIQYQYPYTDNAGTWKLAEQIAALLATPSAGSQKEQGE